MPIGILGVGKCIPTVAISNAEVEARAGLAPGYIAEKTGIEGRFLAEDGQTTSDLAAVAARAALAHAGVCEADLDLLLACTFTPDYRTPAMACKLHKMLGANHALAYDLLANCAAFPIGLKVAADHLGAGAARPYALVVAAALVSRYMDWSDGASSLYFSDGAGAAVLGAVPDGFGFLAHAAFTDSSAYEAVRIRGGGASCPMTPDNIADNRGLLEVNGLDVWKQVVQNQPKVVAQSLARAGLTQDDVALFVFHQANAHLIKYLMGKMRLPMSRTYVNADRLGNSGEASVAVALCEAAEQGLIKHGDVVVVSAAGAGFSFSSSVLRWYDPRAEAA